MPVGLLSTLRNNAAGVRPPPRYPHLPGLALQRSALRPRYPDAPSTPHRIDAYIHNNPDLEY
jgi:hypothetical protein